MGGSGKQHRCTSRLRSRKVSGRKEVSCRRRCWHSKLHSLASVAKMQQGKESPQLPVPVAHRRDAVLLQGGHQQGPFPWECSRGVSTDTGGNGAGWSWLPPGLPPGLSPVHPHPFLQESPSSSQHPPALAAAASAAHLRGAASHCLLQAAGTGRLWVRLKDKHRLTPTSLLGPVAIRAGMPSLSDKGHPAPLPWTLELLHFEHSSAMSWRRAGWTENSSGPHWSVGGAELE